MTEYITQEQAKAIADKVYLEHEGTSLAGAFANAAIQAYRDSLASGVVLPEPDFKYQRYDDTPICDYYTADQYRQGIADALAKQAPQGWKLVPVESTIAMENAAIDLDAFKLGDISPMGFRISPQQLFRECYKRMIAAAPDPKEQFTGLLPGTTVQNFEKDGTLIRSYTVPKSEPKEAA